MAGEKNNQTPALPEQQPDRVNDALKQLKAKVAPAEAVDGLKKEELTQLAERIETERLDLGKEQREQLLLAVKIEALEQQLADAEILALEQRYKSLVQSTQEQPSYVPEWAKPMVENAKSAVNGVFENSKGLFTMIGGFLGKKWESSKDVLKSMKGFFFGALKGDLGKSIPFFGPQISRWAEREYFQESVLNGIRQAVKDKKIPGLTVTLDEASWNPTDSNALIKRLRLHDPAPNADMQSVANDFARQFIEAQAKKITPEKPQMKVVITASELEQATFIKSFPVAPSAPAAQVANSVAAPTSVPAANPSSAPAGTPEPAKGVPSVNTPESPR